MRMENYKKGGVISTTPYQYQHFRLLCGMVIFISMP